MSGNSRGYTWDYKGGDWTIRFGVSLLLVAEGSGWSVSVGRKLFAELKTQGRPIKPTPRRLKS